MIEKIKNAVFRTDRLVCILGNACIVLNMGLVTYNIIARNFLNSSIAGITDYVGFISCLIVALCIGYTEMMNGNPKVDFIVEKLPQTAQKAVFICVSLLDLVVGIALSYSFFKYAASSAAAHTTSMNAALPYAPFLIVCGLGMLLFALTVITKMLYRLSSWGGENV